MPELACTAHEAVDHRSCEEMLDGPDTIDCILLDYSLPGRDGLGVLESIMDRNPLAAVVMITGQGDEAIAVKAMKSGAQDYLTKDVISSASLQRAIFNATERSRMQRKIRDQQESLQTFAHVIVHDLRAPLRAIQQAIEMLTEDLPEQVVAENAEMLNFVSQGATRMDALIIALKAYTDIDGTPPAFETVDLNAQVDHARANLSTIIAESRATITCEDVLPSVLGNPPQIQQLLQNLIANGIKYNRSSVPEIRISSEECAEYFEIGIADNGIGIEADFVERIFEPFKRLHRDSEFSGTGLGLATCRKIADRHSGALLCKSEPGRGSIFTLQLPKI